MRLKEFATIQTGVYRKNAPVPDTYYLQVNDFEEDGTLRSAIQPTTFADKKTARHLLTANDLLLAAKGDKNFCTTAPVYIGQCIASPSFLIIRINNPDCVLPEYVSGFLNLSTTRQLLKVQSKGTSITSLSKLDLEELEIPLLPLERQRACVALTRLQCREQVIYKDIAERRKQIIDYKLTKAYKKDER